MLALSSWTFCQQTDSPAIIVPREHVRDKMERRRVSHDRGNMADCKQSQWIVGFYCSNGKLTRLLTMQTSTATCTIYAFETNTLIKKIRRLNSFTTRERRELFSCSERIKSSKSFDSVGVRSNWHSWCVQEWRSRAIIPPAHPEFLLILAMQDAIRSLYACIIQECFGNHNAHESHS